ncbi:MAG: hypothetical protein ACUZ8E_17385 [Candidatus Anammoxibacter sp.]
MKLPFTLPDSILLPSGFTVAWGMYIDVLPVLVGTITLLVMGLRAIVLLRELRGKNK